MGIDAGRWVDVVVGGYEISPNYFPFSLKSEARSSVESEEEERGVRCLNREETV